MAAIKYANLLYEKFTQRLSQPVEFREEATLTVLDANGIQDVCRYAKNDLKFDYLVDITSVDNLGDDPRFTVVYELYGYEHGNHVRLKTTVSEESPEIPTVTPIWRTAEWHEREIYDMMGIRFRGHPDLRRILMWEGYPYFPLRKDFPLAGKPTDLPEVAFTKSAPLEGGPFVTSPGARTVEHREPRARSIERSTNNSSNEQQSTAS